MEILSFFTCNVEFKFETTSSMLNHDTPDIYFFFLQLQPAYVQGKMLKPVTEVDEVVGAFRLF